MRIYVASSWRNALQPAIVEALRALGHEVYDFRNPAPGNKGFAWSDIDPNWQNWTPEEYRAALQHPIAKAGYALDIGALKACDACVLVLLSGRSASWEFGYAMGQGKRGVVVQLDGIEPELMYREAEIVTSMDELVAAFTEAALVRAEAGAARLVAEQPPPVRQAGRPIWDAVIADVLRSEEAGRDLVIADMRERDRVGRERYGTPLQAFNGRDALLDAYQETLDETAYLAQAREEGKTWAEPRYRAALAQVFALRYVIAIREAAGEVAHG